MAVLRALKKAYYVKCALNDLARAKVNTMRSFQGLPPLMPCYELCIVNTMAALREVCCKAFCPCIMYRRKKPKKLHSNYCCRRMCIDGTYENSVIKHFFGFIGGIVIAMLLYFVMIYQMELNIPRAAIYGSIAGLILTMGLAFSLCFRCIILLIIPTMISSKGRLFLIMYTVSLAMSYPVKNFHYNIMVMSESATCGQSIAYNQTRELVDLAVSPMIGIINKIRQVLTAIKVFAEKLRQIFLSLKKAVQEIVATIKRVAKWLKRVVGRCSYTMGSPYRNCAKAFDDAFNRCWNTLPFIINLACYIVKAVRTICYIARIIEVFCFITDMIKKILNKYLMQPISKAIRKVREMFYVKIKFHYVYSVTMNQSRSFKEVKEGTMKEIKNRLSSLEWFLNILHHLMALAVIYILIRTILYRRNYLTKDKFDNRYLTNQLEALDERRRKLRLERVFPLKKREWFKYTNTCSCFFSFRELRKLILGIVLLTGSVLHVSFYLICDYGLYWILTLIRKHFHVKIDTGRASNRQLDVQGKGVLADMYRTMLSMFDPVATADMKVDTTKCLPDPREPNYFIYRKIGIILGICLIMVITQIFFSRFRHIICACYYPEREKLRAVWLYNHILKTRGGFLKFMRRQLKRKYMNDTSVKEISIMSGIVARCPCIGKILKTLGYERKACLNCGRVGKPKDMDNFQHCENTGCNTVYCLDCFDDLNNICTVCMNPVEYGDDSDFSEERDSSDDASEVARKIERSRKRRDQIEARRHERRGSKQIMTFKNMFGEKKDALDKNFSGRTRQGVDYSTTDDESFDKSYDKSYDKSNDESYDKFYDKFYDEQDTTSGDDSDDEYSDNNVDDRSTRQSSSDARSSLDEHGRLKYGEYAGRDYHYQENKDYNNRWNHEDFNRHNRYGSRYNFYMSPLERSAINKRYRKRIVLVTDEFLSDTDTDEFMDDSDGEFVLFEQPSCHTAEHGLVRAHVQRIERC